MDRVCPCGFADLSIREATSRTFEMPQGSKGGFLDQHDKHLRSHANPVARVASTASQNLDMDAKPETAPEPLTPINAAETVIRARLDEKALSAQITCL
jgi:hypothetical protein